MRKLESRVRLKLNGMDPREGPDPLVIANALASCYITYAAELPAPYLYTANALTIAAGDTFSLPATVSQYGSAEYGGDVKLQLVSSGRYLVRQDHEQMIARRNNQVPIQRSIPEFFELWIDRLSTPGSMLWKGRVYPGAAVAEVCNLFAAMVPDDLRDFVGSGAGDLDTVTVDLGRYGVEGLTFAVAAELLAAMLPEKAQMLGLDKSVVPLWLKKADRALYLEGCWRNEVEQEGSTQRWVV